MGSTIGDLANFNNSIRKSSNFFNEVDSYLTGASYKPQTCSEQNIAQHIRRAQEQQTPVNTAFTTMMKDLISIFELYRNLPVEDLEIIFRNSSSQLPRDATSNLHNLKTDITKFHIELTALDRIMTKDDNELWTAGNSARREHRGWYEQERAKVQGCRERVASASAGIRRVYSLAKFFEEIVTESGVVESQMSVDNRVGQQLYSAMNHMAGTIVESCTYFVTLNK
jgi:hypothetical protein